MTDLDFKTMPKWMPEALEIQMLVDVWARAYEVPREAIVRQIPIAYAWAMSNKNKAPKTRICRYLHMFMKKAKEYGNLTVKPKGSPYKEASVKDDLTYEEMVEIRKRNMGQTDNSLSGKGMA
jgi:hypothetical protein